MLTEKQRSQPVTAQNLADALSWVVVEVFSALKADGGTALERAANQLLQTGERITTEPGRSIILALSENLVEATAQRSK